jgi:hypothetical protein
MIKGSYELHVSRWVFKALTQSLIAAGISAIPWYETFALIHESACRSGPRGKAISAGIRPLTWADSVTFANDWLSFSSHHNHRQTFPALRKSSLESRLAFVQRLSWSCPVCTRKEDSSCFLHSTLDYHEEWGLGQSAGSGTPQEKKKMFPLSRQRRI